MSSQRIGLLTAHKSFHTATSAITSTSLSAAAESNSRSSSSGDGRGGSEDGPAEGRQGDWRQWVKERLSQEGAADADEAAGTGKQQQRGDPPAAPGRPTATYSHTQTSPPSPSSSSPPRRPSLSSLSSDLDELEALLGPEEEDEEEEDKRAPPERQRWARASGRSDDVALGDISDLLGDDGDEDEGWKSNTGAAGAAAMAARRGMPQMGGFVRRGGGDRFFPRSLFEGLDDESVSVESEIASLHTEGVLSDRALKAVRVGDLEDEEQPFQFRKDRTYFPGQTYEPEEMDMSQPLPSDVQLQRTLRTVPTKQALAHADFRNVRFLSQFISETGKINPRHTTRLSAKAQRRVAREIRTARVFGLMPFTLTGRPPFRFGRDPVLQEQKLEDSLPPDVEAEEIAISAVR